LEKYPRYQQPLRRDATRESYGTCGKLSRSQAADNHRSGLPLGGDRRRNKDVS
jgi:hypothetical protein